MDRPIVVAVTGASGAPYAVRLLDVLATSGRTVHVLMSESGRIVLRQELGIEVDLSDFRFEALLPQTDLSNANFVYHQPMDFMSPVASGSYLTEGMVICPCSGTTMSGVVHASGRNLIQRAADVHLKERRKLILVPRETPLSSIQLDNMHRASVAGAIVLPAMPGFYHGATTIQDLVDFVVARILDQLGVEHQLTKRWGSEDEDV